MNRLAIVPARSGSKGLKDKNIKELCGKPLIAYSVEAAVETGLFNQIICSTDSEKYGEIAHKYGASVLIRGEGLSNDKASTFMVIKDVLERAGQDVDEFVLLQPTSPLRTEKHISDAVEKFETRFDEFDFMVSMKRAEFPAVLVKPIEDDLSLKHFNTNFSNYTRQAFQEYSPNGAIFIAKPGKYLAQGHFFGSKSQAYIMDNEDSIDIDNELDFELARICLMRRGSNNDG